MWFQAELMLSNGFSLLGLWGLFLFLIPFLACGDLPYCPRIPAVALDKNRHKEFFGLARAMGVEGCLDQSCS